MYDLKGEILKSAIVVLGNGYDLAHGSKTKYTDFIDSHKNNKNLWIKHFLRKSDLNGWVDVENELITILESVNKVKEAYPEGCNLLELIHNFKSFALFYECELMSDYDGNASGLEYIEYNILQIIEDIKKDFVEVKTLLQEYIKSEVSKNKNYGQNQQIRDVLFEYDNIIVLNFNYTDTISNYSENAHNIFIHGDVDSKIILGHKDIKFPEFSIFNKMTQQRCLSTSYKYDFINKAKLLPPGIYEKAKFNYDFVVLGHSIDKNDHNVLSWVYNTVLGMPKRNVDRLKVFYYKNEYDQDRHSRMYSIDQFYNNYFDLDLPMGKYENNGHKEYKRLQEKNLIEHIELKTIKNDDSTI